MKYAQVVRIAVCDDEKTDREMILKLTEKICSQEKIQISVAGFGDAEELLAAFSGGRVFDLLLLDVMMPGLNGMEFMQKLRSMGNEIPVVFISSNREMALRGYEVAAARYLAKPVEEGYLREALLHCIRQKSKEQPILIPSGGSMRSVEPEKICYIEIAGRKSRIVQEKETWESNLSLTELEERLSGKDFVRCHQSFLVNCRFVRILQAGHLELTGGQKIPVSKHRIKQVRQIFFEYMIQ